MSEFNFKVSAPKAPQTVEVKEWLKKLEDMMNKSKTLKQKVVEFAVFGSGVVAIDEIVQEMTNDL